MRGGTNTLAIGLAAAAPKVRLRCRIVEAMATYRVMKWREIPAQVQASDDSGATANVPLPTFFQQEIDRIAMREGLIDSDEYLEAWNWSEPSAREGSAQDVAEAVGAELAEAWQRQRQAATET